MKRLAFVVVVAAVVLAGTAYWFIEARAGSRPQFKLDEIKRDRLIATVGSTGTLQAIEAVDVGAQVLGRVLFIGKDANTASGIIDWGSEVVGGEIDKEGKMKPGTGTLLARIDPVLYEAQRDAAKASVWQAQANVEQAKAAIEAAKGDVGVKTAILKQAERDWRLRAEVLAKAEPIPGPGGTQYRAITQAEVDQFEQQYHTAENNLVLSKANLESAKATLKTNEALVKVQEANLANAQANLDYCEIRAPCNGKVIDRRVNVGQTVVASLSAPSLFLIAKDIRKMEVWATVNEVDVGRIKLTKDKDGKLIGPEVIYTVDAIQGKVFKGRVVPQGKLPFRLNAVMNSNVVTYTVVVSVQNDEEELKPYMTANLSFIVEDKQNALLVPNAALRWQPKPTQIAPEQREKYLELKSRKPSPTDPQDNGYIFTPRQDGFVEYLQVKIGAGDGSRTEILSTVDGGSVPDGTRVIVGEYRPGQGGGSEANPFANKMFSAPKKD